MATTVSSNMHELIGLALLLGLACLVRLCNIWSRNQHREGVREFYKKHSLLRADEVPPTVRAALPEASNPLCLRGNLTVQSGEVIAFHWWEWSTTSRVSTGNASHTVINNFLAVSFPPFAISEESDKEAVEVMRRHGALQKLRGAFAVDREKPIRAERLEDGSFLICWRVLRRAKILEERLAWLSDNMAAHPLKK